ncbi:uncharacterized protein [Palaemon carinicauda]|uniref:uncharacterized protein n=1 Tax=Palaemon carinicauda TaxID=392227 RepID=UPI0035B60DDE
MRCRGRLEHPTLPEEVKFPTLLPKGRVLSKLLIRRNHVMQAHMGVNATVASIRQEFWIPQLQQLVKSVLYHCVICKKVQGKPYRTNIIPTLPEFRVLRKQPFSVTWVDYTGALWIREGKQNPEKVYFILFTCPITRGIQLEVVKNQSADSFLMALRKFSSRKGFPSLMLSDNATTFVAASEYLKTMADTPFFKTIWRTSSVSGNLYQQEHIGLVQSRRD